MAREKPGIVIFDVDGVLTPCMSSWLYLHRHFGVEEMAILYYKMYTEGIISYLEWLRLDTSLWVDAGPPTVWELRRILSEIPVREEAVEVARLLHRRGIPLVLISSGIDLHVGYVANVLGADLWMANKLSFHKDGRLKPGGVPLVPADRKDLVMRRVLDLYGVPPSRAVYVGDSPWDIPAMLLAGTRVRVGEWIPEEYATHTIRNVGELVEVLDL